MSIRQDSLLVYTSELADALLPWVKRHGQEVHDPRRTGAGRYNGGIRALAEASKVDERALGRIFQKRTTYTTFRTADKLVTGAGMPYLLSDGTIEVIVNPAYTETWKDKVVLDNPEGAMA